jgi:mannosyltransferase
VIKLIERKPVLFILVIAFLLRIASLNQSLWLDEAIGAIAVKDYSYTGIVTDFIKGDTHPPLYYLVLKFWTSIFGYSEVAMRMLSVIFGVATVWVIYLIARFKNEDLRFKKKEMFPILAALLFVVAPLHIYYSQEVRMYAMNTFLVSLLVLFYVRKDFTKYSITLLLLGMTDYLPLLVLPVLWIDTVFINSEILSLRSRMTKMRSFLVAHVPLVIFLILWFPTFIIQSVGSREALMLFPGWGDLIGRAGIKELAFVWIKFLIGRISFDNNIVYGALLLFISLLVSFPFIKSIIEWKKTTILWLWLIVPIALSFLGSIFVPGFSYFRMIIVLPAFYLLLAYGFLRIGSRWLTTAFLFTSLALSLLYLFNPTYHRENWKNAVEYIQSSRSPNDIVLQAFPEPFAGYRWYAGNNQAYGATGRLGATDQEIKANTNEILTNTHSVFYFRYLEDQTDPHGVIKQTIQENGFEEISEQAFRGIGIVEYWKRD